MENSFAGFSDLGLRSAARTRVADISLSALHSTADFDLHGDSLFERDTGDEGGVAGDRGDGLSFIKSANLRRQGSFRTNVTRTLYIQMEFCPATLHDRLYNPDYENVDEATAWHILRQILQGLWYLHDAGVIHRDLKPSNLFMDSQGNIKIEILGLQWMPTHFCVKDQTIRQAVQSKKGWTSCQSKCRRKWRAWSGPIAAVVLVQLTIQTSLTSKHMVSALSSIDHRNKSRRAGAMTVARTCSPLELYFLSVYGSFEQRTSARIFC